MINVEDQEALFKLIAENIDNDITCIAIGGTAMMFAGYKPVTKDIDLVFQSVNDRLLFISAIKKFGYKERSIIGVYDDSKVNSKSKPLMFTRGDERFDLFVIDIFGFKLEFNQNKITQRHDFIGTNELIIYILSREYLILLKAITNREKDFEDIETIIEKTPIIKWDEIIDLAIEQKDDNPRILIDLEATLKKLSKKIFLPEKYFRKIYDA